MSFMLDIAVLTSPAFFIPLIIARLLQTAPFENLFIAFFIIMSNSHSTQTSLEHLVR
jgi:hypothetical protein